MVFITPGLFSVASFVYFANFSISVAETKAIFLPFTTKYFMAEASSRFLPAPTYGISAPSKVSRVLISPASP